VPARFRFWFRPVGFRLGLWPVGFGFRFRPVRLRLWPVGFRLGLWPVWLRFWIRFVTSATRLASLASITTAIVTSLATLATIVISIIISIIITALATLAAISVAVATLARLAIWFRFGVVWLGFRILHIFPISDRLGLGLIPSLRKKTRKTKNVIYNEIEMLVIIDDVVKEVYHFTSCVITTLTESPLDSTAPWRVPSTSTAVTMVVTLATTKNCIATFMTDCNW
jgi:hypothetical protein